MKITEIEVGKVYFSSTSRDWQYAGWGVNKVRVLIAKHTTWEWNKTTKAYEETKYGSYRSKKGVLVQVLTGKDDAVAETTVIPLGSIKGLWNVVNPVVENNRAERQKAEDAYAEKLSTGYKAVEDNYQKAKSLALVGVGTRGTENTVTPETMAMLLDMWAAHREA